MGRTNLAGRAGRWSASHWKTAAFGWIAFAVVAVVVGSAIGARQMKSWAIANGESRRAEQILDQGDFKIPARESVLVQSATGTAEQPEFSAAVGSVVLDLSQQPDVAAIISPIEYPNAGLISRDRHSVLVQFDVERACGQGEGQDCADHGGDPRRPGRPSGHDRGGVRTGVGGLPGRPAVRAGHGPGRGDLAAADGRDPDRRVRRARRGGPARHPGLLRRAGRDRAEQSRQPRRSDRRPDAERDHPDDRNGGRDRLLAVLPPARAGGAEQRTVATRSPARGCAHVGPGGR